ncbi:hypothetical protein [Steroidobacter sp.]|uniref:hypothetical protein n=1 Tax=Steroidobacter sp. TaxID=1978227 RepID=UPI001A4156E5|nr:hypothetical protein [Steroidobacter sp.]MBL8271889.1 hypothetical protein [Steroidobacter sp.]
MLDTTIIWGGALLLVAIAAFYAGRVSGRYAEQSKWSALPPVREQMEYMQMVNELLDHVLRLSQRVTQLEAKESEPDAKEGKDADPTLRLVPKNEARR